MQLYVQRLLGGDATVLPLILYTIGEYSSSFSALAPWEKSLYQHLVKLLLVAGKHLKNDTHNITQSVAIEHGALAQRILCTAFLRGGDTATEVCRSLLQVGIRGCREMRLDRYIDVSPGILEHVLQFVLFLTKLFHVRPSDILTGRESNQRAEHAGRAHTLSPSLPAQWGFSENSRLETSGNGIVPRRSNHRRWRDLPGKPSYVPSRQNPLYSDREGEGYWIPPQFPTPVLAFARKFGIGCEPHLPNLSVSFLPTTLLGSGASEDPHFTVRSPSIVASRRLMEARNFEQQGDSLFSRYLSNGLLLIWGSGVAFNGLENFATKFESETGSTFSDAFFFSPIVLTPPIPVVSMTCGAKSCHVVTVENKVYSCGSNEHGQLGCGQSKDTPLFFPRIYGDGHQCFYHVPLCSEDRIVKVEAGSEFVVAVIRERNQMYFWGGNGCGQCLLPESKTISGPVMVDVPKEYGQIKEVACGSVFAAVLFSDDKIGMWGKDSMLGVTLSSEKLCDTETGTGTRCAKHTIFSKPIEGEIVALRAGPFHCIAITSAGHAYSWGVDRSGSLGHGTEHSGNKIQRIESLANHVVIDASCGSFHSAVLTRDGIVLVFGENTCGQLGLRGEAPRTTPEPLPLPKPAIAVSCGREHTCVLLEDGDIMSCGTVRSCGMGLGYGARFNIPQRIFWSYLLLSIASKSIHGMAVGLPRSLSLHPVGASNGIVSTDELRRLKQTIMRQGVRTVAAGNGFLLVVTVAGEVQAIGQSQRGQLGIGDTTIPCTDTFKKVAFPERVVLCAVDCGADYAIGLSSHCGVYSWGWNSHGQLGHGDSVPLHESLFTPREIKALRWKEVTQVACGGTFAVALTQEGEVYTWGESLYCGHPRVVTPCLTTPMLLEGLKDVVAVAAGVSHAVALSYDHKIYAWGRGPLGNGGSCNTIECTPVVLKFAHCVRQLGCGPFNTFAITDLGELFVWGLNDHGQCGVHHCEGPPPSWDEGLNSHTDRKQERRQRHATSSSEVLFPTHVAHGVRDAAFGASCGILIWEDGSSAVSGEIHQDGKKVLFHRFTPQRLTMTSRHQNKEGNSSHVLGKESSPVFFSRCFGGFDMLFVLLEWERPSATEVAGAICNMKACLHSPRTASGGVEKKEKRNV
ncbi:putative regulator of chromosome condensation [Trypanosoma cruzi]|uniref:RCC1-like domain-containing protein n=2 Tax=Trypanosoma cruzi TaxID=5693 RepID=Q4DJ80_TRYCC|nr:hypothetical protein, conserved [Trypanosoma cruzi]EAN92581.1 hypothetical protein, conserved [Trypanosoma cruzi]PWV20894.1 putative regulator of chromosome condensation [Trypanosoma cruzi]RNC49267.1 regulator of chromosome condensation [Trypanosoma cruzi]|eukprot:XP_814432.1 hypothetical protein [Trypanosoma cruzi strain CL Brener]